MALTVGTGPFGGKAAGRFNFSYDAPAHVIYLEPTPRRVRVAVAGETVADSRNAWLLHETGIMPVYYFPEADLRRDLLVSSETRTHCPFKGDAVHRHVVAGDRRVDDAAWTYPKPNPELPDLAGLVAFYWSKADAWFEEEEEIFVHPRDPYHRVDVLPTARHVRVSMDGVVLADSRETMVLFESGLPPRYYFPRADVDFDHLAATGTDSRCPYKGHATLYWSATTPRGTYPDVAWSYPDPLPAVARIEDRVCFYDEKLDVDLDGERQDRPVTKFS